MKFEVEISEETLKTACNEKVKLEISRFVESYPCEDSIKTKVRAAVPSAIDAILADVLSNSAELRAKVVAEVERKMRLQIAAVMRAEVK
jgi:hypothetical protein